VPCWRYITNAAAGLYDWYDADKHEYRPGFDRIQRGKANVDGLNILGYPSEVGVLLGILKELSRIRVIGNYVDSL
jgi:hypothetical protein